MDSCVRLARPSDRQALARLLAALWPESTPEEHVRELEPILAGKAPGNLPLVLFVAEDHDGSLIGFLEAGLRSHAEKHRRRGIGRSLLLAAEEWSRRQGCVEMASDALIDNELSQRVHKRLGFQVVERSVHFRKELRKAGE